MTRHIKSQQLLLRLQLLPLRPIRKIFRSYLRTLFPPCLRLLHQTKQCPLPPFLVPRGRGRQSQRPFHFRRQPGPIRTHLIKRPAPNQTLHRFLVHRLVIHSGTEILHRNKFSTHLPRFHNRLHTRSTHILDRPQSKKNSVGLNRKLILTRIDTRRLNDDSHVLCFRRKERDLVRIIQLMGQQ